MSIVVKTRAWLIIFYKTDKIFSLHFNSGAGKTLVGVTAACTVRKRCIVLCTSGTSSVHNKKRARLLTKLVIQQAVVKMRSFGLGKLVHDKSIVSCQELYYKLILQTCSRHACCTLFHKSANNDLKHTSLF